MANEISVVAPAVSHAATHLRNICQEIKLLGIPWTLNCPKTVEITSGD